VPDVIPLDVYDSDKVFISVVSMECRNVRLANLPWPRFNYYQLNLRTYITDPLTGGRAVYFIQSGVTSAMTSYLTRLIGIPWQRIPFELNIDRENEGYQRFYSGAGNWNGEIVIKASDFISPQDSTGSSKITESIADYITGPLIGLIGPKGRTIRFGIRHKALDVWSGKLDEISYPFLLTAGILDEEEILQPHNVFAVPEAEFTIMLPPKRI
jgi:hypothetical protein